MESSENKKMSTEKNTGNNKAAATTEHKNIKEIKETMPTPMTKTTTGTASASAGTSAGSTSTSAGSTSTSAGSTSAVTVMNTANVEKEECFPLLALPLDILAYVFQKLDAMSLVHLELTSQTFRSRNPMTRLRLTEQAAREALHNRFNMKLDDSWKKRDRSWKERLYLEEAGSGFDTELGEREGFAFEKDENNKILKQVKLVGLGPKMLVSDVSSHQQSVMRWKLRVKGNTAVEFGIVPVALQERKKALHKCLAETENILCVGFCSQITVGSQLPFRCPVVKGTVVEMSIKDGKASFTVSNPSDGWDVHWENDRRVHSQYRGPSEIHFVQDFSPVFDVKLALTAWAKAEFDVIHTCQFSTMNTLKNKQDKFETVMNNSSGPSSTKIEGNTSNIPPESPVSEDMDELIPNSSE